MPQVQLTKDAIDQLVRNGLVEQMLQNGLRDKEGEIEYFESLLTTLKSGDTATAIESVEGAIGVLKR